MENDIIAAHIVCTQGGRVVPAFRLQRSEAVDQIGYVFSGGSPVSVLPSELRFPAVRMSKRLKFF